MTDYAGVPVPALCVPQSKANIEKPQACGYQAVAAMAENQAKASSEKSGDPVLNTELVVFQQKSCFLGYRGPE